MTPMSRFNGLARDPDEENRLVQSIRQGNKEAYEKLYNRYAPLLLGLINRILCDQHRSEKVLQAAFLRYWQEIRLHNFTREPLFVWMTRVARDLALEAKKTAAPVQQKNRAAVTLVYMEENANFTAPEPAAETGALELVCNKGYTLEEAAEACGISRETLVLKLRKELNQLREVKINE